MRCRKPALALATALLAAPAAAPAADTPDQIQPTDAVPGHPGVTWLDLIRQVAPDLAWNDTDNAYEGHLATPMRHAGGQAYQADPPDPLKLGLIFERRIQAAGKPRIALMADFGQPDDFAESYTMLGLYDDTAPTPKLLDVVDVGVDLDTDFGDVLPLSPADDAVTTYSGHFNTSASYDSGLVLFVQGDRFRLLVDLPSMLSTHVCSFEHDETSTLSTAPGKPFRQVVLTVTDVLTRTGETGCGDGTAPRPFRHTLRATWSWNPAKGAWVGATGGLDPLDKENQTEF